MKKVVLFLLLLFSPVMNSQIMGEDEVYLGGELIQPKFNGGGMKKFSEFIHENLDRSKITKAGTLLFSFTIEITGEIKNIKILQFNDAVIAAEIIRVIKLAPKWQPAIRNGKPVSLEVKYPIQFK